MSLRFLLAFLTALILCVSSCKVENKPVNSDLKSAFYFQQGTYWIYKEALSGAIDSFYVFNIALTSGYGKHHSYTFDIIREDINSMRIDTPVLVVNGTWHLTMQLNTFNFGFSMEFMANALNTDLYLNNYNFLTYPFAKYTDPTDSVNMVGAYQLNGNTFDNVWRAHFTEQPGYIADKNDFIFMNSDVFMVRMILNDTFQNIHKDYQLLRWHIQK